MLRDFHFTIRATNFFDVDLPATEGTFIHPPSSFLLEVEFLYRQRDVPKINEEY